jgi:hypothetical protein
MYIDYTLFILGIYSILDTYIWSLKYKVYHYSYITMLVKKTKSKEEHGGKSQYPSLVR